MLLLLWLDKPPIGWIRLQYPPMTSEADDTAPLPSLSFPLLSSLKAIRLQHVYGCPGQLEFK